MILNFSKETHPRGPSYILFKLRTYILRAFAQKKIGNKGNQPLERNFIFIFYKKWRSLANLTERDRIIHIDKDISQIIAKYVHLMFQKRKELLIQ